NGRQLYYLTVSECRAGSGPATAATHDRSFFRDSTLYLLDSERDFMYSNVHDSKSGALSNDKTQGRRSRPNKRSRGNAAGYEVGKLFQSLSGPGRRGPKSVFVR